MTSAVQTRVAPVWLDRKERLEAQLLFLLGVAAFLVRIWGMSKTHFWDEMVYLQNAQVICCGKTNYSELDFRPPLISLIFAGVFLLWHHIYAACIVTALMNAMGPVLLYLAGRRVVGRLPAAIAAVLLAFSPFFAGVIPDGLVSDDTGNSLLTDSPAVTLLLLAFWLLLRALDRESGPRFAWAGLALALCILMRFGTLPMVGILLLLPLAAKRRWMALTWCGVGLLLGMAPYLVWSRVNFGAFFFTIREGWTHAEESGEPTLFYVQNCVAIFTPVALLGLAIAATGGLWRLIAVAAQPRMPAPLIDGPSPRGTHAFLWIWLLAGFVLFSAMPHKEPRYLLPIAPPLLLLAGVGLGSCCRLPRTAWRRGGMLVVAALLLVTFLPLRERLGRPFIDRAEPVEMVASQYLESNLPRGTVLYMTFNYPAFAFYTSHSIHELSAVGPPLYSDIERIPPGQVLIVYRNTDEVQEPRFEWVDANPRFQRMRDFSAFVVYRRLAETRR